MRTKLGSYLPLLLLVLISIDANTQGDHSPTNLNRLRTESETNRFSATTFEVPVLVSTTEEAELFDRWSLNVEERTRYLDIMNTYQRVWYSHLSPLEVLAINAESEAERNELAERLFMIEYYRLERELKLQRSYDLAANKLFPNESIFGNQRTSNSQFSSNSLVVSPSYSPSMNNNHFVVVLRTDCSSNKCKSIVSKVIERDNKIFDLYFTDTTDELSIQKWASENKIPVDRVNSRSITLNYSDGGLKEALRLSTKSPINVYSLQADGQLLAINDVKSI